MNPSEAEESLYNRFQDTLDSYYEWEENAKQEFHALTYPDPEED